MLLRAGAFVFGPPALFIFFPADGHHDFSGVVKSPLFNQFVEFVLIDDTHFAVQRDYLRFKAKRGDMRVVVVQNVVADCIDAIRVEHDRFLLAGTVRQIRCFVFCQSLIFDKRVKGCIERVLIEVPIHQAWLDNDGYGSLIRDSAFHRVLGQHLSRIFLVTEQFERVAPVNATFVNGRARHAEETSVRDDLAHLHAEIAVLGAVRLIDHHDHVVIRVPHLTGVEDYVFELPNRGHDDAGDCVRDRLFELFCTADMGDVRDTRITEVIENVFL